jgi:hypothetical protein
MLLAASTLARLALIQIYKKAKPPVEDWRRWAFWAISTALVGGSCWGLGALLLLDPRRVEAPDRTLAVCDRTRCGVRRAQHHALHRLCRRAGGNQRAERIRLQCWRFSEVS